MPTPPKFDATFRTRLRELLIWRRDVRKFRTDALPEHTAEALIDAARLAPSVGLSEPWRFVIVEDPARRGAIRANFETANADALGGYSGDQALLYARLKLAGLDKAPLQIAVFADEATDQGHRLGRNTMPETIAYSTVTAIHTIWLTARAEGMGLGWVSILDPSRMAEDLEVPPEWRFIAYLCIGYPAEDANRPALERAGWEQRGAASDVIFRR